MFLGFHGLTNPQAIQLTKANAYRAAQIVMGTGAQQSQLYKAATDYTNFIAPKLNRYATVQQIITDPEFAMFVSRAKDGNETVSEKIERANSAFGLSDSLLFGIPNWVLYGAAGFLGYQYYKKHGFKLPASSVASTPIVAGPAPVEVTK